MYHVAGTDRAAAIALEGLKAGASEWSNSDEWDEGIYLWDQEDLAQLYALDIYVRGRDQDYLLLRVDVRELELFPDTSGENDQRVAHAWYSRQPIPVERLSEETLHGWRPLA